MSFDPGPHTIINTRFGDKIIIIKFAMKFAMKFFAVFVILAIGTSTGNLVGASNTPRKPFVAEHGYYYYKSNHKLQESVVRPLFNINGDVPAHGFPTRKLTSYGPYYTARKPTSYGPYYTARKLTSYGPYYTARKPTSYGPYYTARK